MSSLLSPFHFGQKHSYFHVQVTIHELTNVPLVSGKFACKWRVKGSHSLASIQQSASAAAQQHYHRHHHNHSSHNSSPGDSLANSQQDLSASVSSSVTGRSSNRHASGRLTDVTVTAPSSEALEEDADADPGSASRSLRHRSSRATIASTASSSNLRPSRHSSSSSPEASLRAGSDRHGHHNRTFLHGMVDALKGKGKSHDQYHEHDVEHEKGDGLQEEPDDDQGGRSREQSPSAAAVEASSDASRRDSMASRRTTESKKTTASAKSKKGKADSLRSDANSQCPGSDHNLDPYLFFTQEPKGETNFVRVKDHSVKFNRKVQSGVRVGIDKPKPAANSSASSIHRDSPNLSEKASGKDLRARRDRDESSKDATSAFGCLAESELRITVKQVIPSTSSSTHSPSTLGYIVLNLAEYAPDPPAGQFGSHHHHHHHHHHHAHKTTRSETRRYLLRESKTNAVLKATVAMTFIGGSREYSVPRMTNGMFAGGLAQIMEATSNALDHHQRNQRTGPRQREGDANRHSSSSDTSSLRNDQIDRNFLTLAPGSANEPDHVRSRGASASTLSLPQLQQAAFYGSALRSAQRKKTSTNVPSHNFRSDANSTSSRNNSTALTITGTTHHDRAPEDIVDAIFKGVNIGGNSAGAPSESGSRARNLLSATAVKSDKAGRGVSGSSAPGAKSERPAIRPRTQSTASNVSKKSDQSFSFANLRNKDKDAIKKPNPASSVSNNSAATSPVTPFKPFAARTDERNDGDSRMARSNSSTTITGQPSRGLKGPIKSILGRNATSEVNLDDLGKSARTKVQTDASTNTSYSLTAKEKRLSYVRWELDEPGKDDEKTLKSAKKASDDADTVTRDGFLKPPSEVVGHSYVPIRAGGIQSGSTDELDVRIIAPRTTSDTIDGSARSKSPLDDVAAKAELLESLPSESNMTGLGLHLESLSKAPISARHSDNNLNARARGGSCDQSQTISIFHATSTLPSSRTSTLKPPEDASLRKTSSSDLRSTYRTQLPFASGLGSGAVVGLERIKKTSRAVEQFAKDALSAMHDNLPSDPRTKLFARVVSPSFGSPRPSAHMLSSSLTLKKRVPKGTIGIQPNEAVSRGWRGAGWQLALEQNVIAGAETHHVSSRASSQGGRGSISSTATSGYEIGQESGRPDSAEQDLAARPSHRRQESDISVYYDVDDGPDESASRGNVDSGEYKFEPASIPTLQVQAAG